MARVALLVAALAAGALAVTVPHPYTRLSRPLPKEALARVPRAPAPPSGVPAPPALPPSCRPGQTCWPTPSEWAAFNASVAGRLIQVSPPLADCFPPAYDPAACDAGVNNFSSSFWRAAQPGAMQSPNLEQDPVTGDCCFDPAKPCELGNVPPFAVAVASDADVSAALVFASAHKLRVVIKSSGHEYQGRSTAADALLLWTHALRGITTSATFAACAGDAPVPAITSKPGDAWGDVYAVADSLGAAVVGGSEVSVSSAGGYTLGGGHSWQGPTYGMAVDNVLQATVVLANGSSVTASACSHPELFRALRGGGGGTFGVMTSVTYAMHPHPPGGAAGALILVKALRGAGSVAMLIDAFLAALPDLNTPLRTGVVAGGYFFFSQMEPDWTFAGRLCFNGTVAQANAALAPLAAWVAANPLDVTLVTADVSPFPSLIAWHESWDGPEATGSAVTLGSRLVPRAVLADTPRREALAINLTALSGVVEVEGLLVAGGAVAAADAGGRSTSVSASWRNASFHLVIGAGWALNATIADQQSTIAAITSLTGVLRTALPESGAYFSESDLNEPNWQTAFWAAATYARLQAVKAAVDPTGVFGCHHCVELPA